MSRKTRYRLAPINTLIVIVFLCISAFSLYLFWKDLNSTSSRSDKDQIATISFRYKVAQRKYSDRVVWERLQNESPLYPGDTIRTGDLAQATVSFENGAVLSLKENTMLQILVSDEGGIKISVAISDGDLEVDTTSSSDSIAVQTQSGVTLNLDQGSKLVAKSQEDSNDSSFQMVSGSASVNSSDSTMAITAGEAVKIDKGGEVKRASITVTSIPLNHRILNFTDDAVKASLEWQLSGNADGNLIVESSRNKNFDKLDVQKNVSDRNSYNLPLFTGVNYWRIYYENHIEDAVAGKIIVDKVDKVLASVPADASYYTYRADNPRINISWTGNSYANYYRLEIARDSKFENKVFDSQQQNQSLVINSLSEGKYWWRVSPYYSINSIGYGQPTQVRSFTIEQMDSYSAPVLAIPANNSRFIYDGETFDANFGWKSEIKDSKYKVVFAKDQEFKQPVKTIETGDKRLQEKLSVSEFSQGKYYWKVIQTYKDALTSEPDLDRILESSVLSFNVEKYEPEKSRLLYPADGFSVEGQKISSTNFMWKLADEKTLSDKNVKVQFAYDKDFQNLAYESDTASNSIQNVKLKNGGYYWRVLSYRTALDGSEQVESTDARRLQVVPKLAAPRITYPKDRANIILPKGSVFTARWDKVDGADFYKARLINPENKALINEVTINNATSASFDLGKLEKSRGKNYVLEVQSYCNASDFSDLREGYVSSISFDSKLPSPVVLLSPKNKAYINGLDALREETQLSWKSGSDSYSSSQLVLWKLNENGNPKPFRSFANPRNTVKLSRLTEGTYRWTVKASDSDGINLDAEDTYEFTVLPVVPLSSPNLKKPENNFVMGPKFLKNNRSITFTWDKVNGASDYSFVLYQKNKDGTLRKIAGNDKIRGTQFKFTEMSKLDVASFEWQVTAYAHAKDGYEEQKSKTSVGVFKIDLPLPKSIEVIDPGVMYGE
ncbi:MAG: FecR family protein [Treponemataceae bacterium]|nr:FecR family protein [Treponemataceae bacterium]